MSENINYTPIEAVIPKVESNRINLPQFDTVLPDFDDTSMELLAELTIRKQPVKY